MHIHDRAVHRVIVMCSVLLTVVFSFCCDKYRLTRQMKEMRSRQMFVTLKMTNATTMRQHRCIVQCYYVGIGRRYLKASVPELDAVLESRNTKSTASNVGIEAVPM